MSPFPATWFLDLVKEGPPQGSVGAFVTPHRPDCTLPVPEPIPGIATRIPGKYVTGLSISFTGVPLS
ncbi:hypothetical protein [Actinoplanes sp. NPDC051494]|uniref:hypothetical protein n=1 Tax=Actinoplanes sp. NPDC051494 TaxID=3363907 RepID=UPI0037BA775B